MSPPSDNEVLQEDNAHSADEDVHASANDLEISAEDIYACRIAIPVNPYRCKARTYDLWQCSKPLQPDSEFCAQHVKGALKHGRIENPVPDWLREDFLRTAHTRIKRGHQLQWYCRHNMWEFAKKLHKDCVEDLTDAELIDGLNSVHNHFKWNVSQRAAWNIEQKKGPLTLEKIDTTLTNSITSAHLSFTHSTTELSLFMNFGALTRLSHRKQHMNGNSKKIATYNNTHPANLGKTFRHR